MIAAGLLVLAAPHAAADTASPAQADPDPDPGASYWASFSRAPALDRSEETVDIATAPAPAGAATGYRMRHMKRRHGGPAETKWADSRSCPAMLPLIASMRTLPVPRIAPFGMEEESGMVALDGTTYRLTAPSSFDMGEITITSNVGTPLANWIDQALETLASCWTTSPHRRHAR